MRVIENTKVVEIQEKVEDLNIPHDTCEYLRKISKEFREDFSFKHFFTAFLPPTF